MFVVSLWLIWLPNTNPIFAFKMGHSMPLFLYHHLFDTNLMQLIAGK